MANTTWNIWNDNDGEREAPREKRSFVRTFLLLMLMVIVVLGVVLIASYRDGTGFDALRGNYLILDHGEGLTTLYGHCWEVLAAAGDSVTEGQTIAAVGSTGMSTGPHLHFEVRQDGEARNPIAFFDAAIRDTLKMG